MDSGGSPPNDVLDNSFFLENSGGPRKAEDMAKLILHETTHDVYRVGTVGFWPSVAYYLEAVFLFRTSTHSAENRPYATTEEFMWWYQAREERMKDGPGMEELINEEFQAHLRHPGENCEHGPFPEVPEPPVPR